MDQQNAWFLRKFQLEAASASRMRQMERSHITPMASSFGNPKKGLGERPSPAPAPAPVAVASPKSAEKPKKVHDLQR
jgi:hypothetical protein